MGIIKQFRKNLSLRIVNFAGLSIMLTCILLSAAYIKQELSYDRHYAYADRIVRLSLQFDGEPVDGRVLGNSFDDELRQIPEVERVVKMVKIPTAVVTYNGSNHMASDLYMVSRDFLQVFDIPLLHGNKDEVLQQKEQILISVSFAHQLLRNDDLGKIQGSEIFIEGRNFIISGIFKDIPKTSHFHTDILLHRPDDRISYTYTYLLLRNQTDINMLEQKMTQLAEEKKLYQPSNPQVILMPLTDIHLHSHNLREMSINGNINFIYLIIGANMLLLIVVLFNLWLNTSLMFSYNRRYYQILRLNGAQPNVVIKDEVFMALLCGVLSIAIGGLSAYCLSSFGIFSGQITAVESIALCLLFLLLLVVVSLLPALKNMSSTLFLNTEKNLNPKKFSYSNVKWMLTIQYAVVIISVILAFSINKQMNLVKNMQVGGNDHATLVMQDQPEQVMEKFDVLHKELLTHVEIKSVTTAFQLPGDAVRDATKVRREDDMNWQQLPVMIVGEGFFPFFNIGLLAGHGFRNSKFDYYTEEKILSDRIEHKKFSEHIEEYVINRKAMLALGFTTPSEAIGKILHIEHGTIDYFQKGTIVGVTDDFNYTGLYQETIPMLLMQRRLFQFCIMVQLDPDRLDQAKSVFENVWNKVYPNNPANYVFLNDMFAKMYRNEISAKQLVFIFSLLCFCLADLGLIVFMAFITQRRAKEIAIRKVHGASISNVIKMLNMNFIRYIGLAFVIAIPVAYYIMNRWLDRFAYRVSLDWWLFVLGGFIVLLISFASVSLQSWRAATANPSEAMKKS